MYVKSPSNKPAMGREESRPITEMSVLRMSLISLELFPAR